MYQPQTNNQNSLSARAPWQLVSDGYAETTMLVFEQLAYEASAASKLKPNSTRLDVACDPGTLAIRLAQHAGQIHSIDFSETMLAGFCNKVEQTGHRNIKLHCGNAQTLPYADATFDAAFSLFGLMFFPDRQGVMARERKAGTGLSGRDAACAERAADFGYLIGVNAK